MTIIPFDSSMARSLWNRTDRVWLFIGTILLAVLLLAPADFPGILQTAVGALLNTAPFILFAIMLVAYLKATDAEHLIAKAFEGSETRMIILAALVGGLSPFCSCEIIPFIAAMLALGVPVSAVMALWLSSPLMDPAMFTITASGLGVEFAVAKTISAVALGIFGGFAMRALNTTGLFADPLKERAAPKSCCGGPKAPYQGQPVWKFWEERERVTTFRDAFVENGLFLFKWLALAYVIEALMIAYVPASLIAGILGGDGLQPILLGALIGGPAYLNGYAAVPLLEGLLAQGMSPGAAMSFVIAGGVSSIPAAIAVWALVKPKVFAAYISLGVIGAVIAGLGWAAYAA